MNEVDFVRSEAEKGEVKEIVHEDNFLRSKDDE